MGVNSLFGWRFRCRCLRCCLGSLLVPITNWRLTEEKVENYMIRAFQVNCFAKFSWGGTFSGKLNIVPQIGFMLRSQWAFIYELKKDLIKAWTPPCCYVLGVVSVYINFACLVILFILTPSIPIIKGILKGAFLWIPTDKRSSGVVLSNFRALKTTMIIIITIIIIIVIIILGFFVLFVN